LTTKLRYITNRNRPLKNDEEMIAVLLDGKRVLGSVSEVAEANGAIEMYRQLDKLNYKKENDLLKSHKILMNELLNRAGDHRKSNIGVGGKDGVVDITPPSS